MSVQARRQVGCTFRRCPPIRPRRSGWLTIRKPVAGPAPCNGRLVGRATSRQERAPCQQSAPGAKRPRLSGGSACKPWALKTSAPPA